MGDGVTKPGRKPLGLRAMTPAERKAAQRIRSLERVWATVDESEWTEADCLLILQRREFRGKFEEKLAWLQLGRLRGFTA